MASKTKTVYVCSNCGHETSKWYGQCPACQEWNTMEEELRTVETGSAKKRSLSSYANRASVQKLQEISADTEHRFDTGLRELNRVLGGGIVKGSLVLLSGDPGIGKSTLLCKFASISARK